MQFFCIEDTNAALRVLSEDALMFCQIELPLGDSREFLNGLSQDKRGALDLETLRCEGESFMQSQTKRGPSPHHYCLHPQLSQPNFLGVFHVRGRTPGI